MSSDAWKDKNTVRFTMRFTENSGIPDALRKIQAEKGITPSAYIREVLLDALQRDGYLSDNSTPE